MGKKTSSNPNARKIVTKYPDWSKIKRKFIKLYNQGIVVGKNISWETFSFADGPHGNGVKNVTVSALKMQVTRNDWWAGLEKLSAEEIVELEKKAVGTLYDPKKHPDEAQSLAELGHNNTMIYRLMKLTKGEFHVFCDKYQEFRDAILEGRRIFADALIQKRHELAMGREYTEEKEVKERIYDKEAGAFIMGTTKIEKATKVREPSLAAIDRSLEEVLPEEYGKNRVEKSDEEKTKEKLNKYLDKFLE